jgi:sarcosine oxidase delta subunit
MEEPLDECPYCGKSFKKKGMPSHKRACKKAKEEEEEEARYILRRSQGMWIE